MNKQGVRSSTWFPVFDLICASTAVILWLLDPSLGLVPLAVGPLPALIRLLGGKPPLARTPFDLPVLLFLVTAFIGVWTAYHAPTAWAKFWLLAGGVLLFYALAGQPRANHWGLAGFLSLIGAGIALFYLLTGSWEIYPAKVSAVNRLGLWWMSIRPALPFFDVHPNNVAGIAAFCAPFSLAILLRGRETGSRRAQAWAVAALLVSAAAFVLATSRGAAFALTGGLLIWSLHGGAERFRIFPGAAGSPFLRAARTAALLLAAGGALYALWLLFQVQPGAAGRINYSTGALELLQDFLFTGAGLGSFPGLYSQYILVINTFFVLNSHNTFLDIGLEQGIFGLVAFAAVYAGSLYLTATRPGAQQNEDAPADLGQSRLLSRAALTGLTVILLHGLLDNIVYDPGGAPLVFFLPGVAAAITRSTAQAGQKALPGPSARRIALAAGAAVLVLALAAAVFYRPILATLYANLGAVQMAKAELADFPRDRWNTGENLPSVALARPLFEQALAYQPDQRTAHDRLGLIALLARDFPTAVSHLQAAHRLDPAHRGITKNLAYALVWNGQLEQAVPMLATLPEARVEMSIYVNWWNFQGHTALSQQALEAAEALGGVIH